VISYVSQLILLLLLTCSLVLLLQNAILDGAAIKFPSSVFLEIHEMGKKNLKTRPNQHSGGLGADREVSFVRRANLPGPKAQQAKIRCL
jgi:hypothetical protein